MIKPLTLQALQFGWLDFSKFDVEEYEHYEVLLGSPPLFRFEVLIMSICSLQQPTGVVISIRCFVPFCICRGQRTETSTGSFLESFLLSVGLIPRVKLRMVCTLMTFKKDFQIYRSRSIGKQCGSRSAGVYGWGMFCTAEYGFYLQITI